MHACAISVSLVLGACGADQTTRTSLRGSGDASTSVPQTVGIFADTSASGMRAALQEFYQANSGYRKWANNGLHPIDALKVHGISYDSPNLERSMAASRNSHPVGSMSVLELFADSNGESLKGWAVLAKTAPADEPSSWFSYELVVDEKGAFGKPKALGMGASLCAGCHVPSPSYILHKKP
jgi:hypothetical protein